MKTEAVILVGGFCEMVELCQRSGFEVVGVIDATPLVSNAYGLPYFGTDDQFLDCPAQFLSIPLVVVPDAPAARRRIVERYRLAGFRFSSVISPDADVSRTSELHEGVVIQSHVVITAKARIGAFAKLNIGVSVFHECRIGDYVTVAPRATLLGRVQVGDDAYIGTSSTILPERIVGKGSTVGAGAVVTRDVADWQTVAGVPAKRFEQA
jgi:sugar O-acyltransferase (sialic acid O-acetyltransferase NeuD family)